MRETIEALGVLGIYLGGIALLVADRTNGPTGRLLPDAALWLAGFAALIGAGLFGLRALRRRRFGAVPASTEQMMGSPLMGAAMGVLGPLFLVWAVSVVRQDGWSSAAIALLLFGACLTVLPLCACATPPAPAPSQ